MVRMFLVLVWLCLAGAASAQMAEVSVPTLTVTGEGRAAAVPDMATITLGVSARETTAAAAMDETSQAVARILERLEGMGLQPRDIQTSDLSLNPIWSHRQSGQEGPDLEGFEASNRLTLRVRDLDTLGAVLEAALADGANRLGGLSFGLRDPQPLLDAARRDAVRDARDRARIYAEAAGLTLGPVLRISEAGGGGQPRPMGMEMARAADVPVAAGETGLEARVEMVFALEP